LRPGERSTQREEIFLNGLGRLPDLRVFAERAGESEYRAQLVDGAVGLYPEIALGNSLSADESGLPLIACLC
jgi:hypothetical protein